jgi:predicted DNA-binding transcriptional regulator AlpA
LTFERSDNPRTHGWLDPQNETAEIRRIHSVKGTLAMSLKATTPHPSATGAETSDRPGLERLIMRAEVMRLFGLKSRGTLDQFIEKKILPPPVRVGTRNTAWPESEIRAVQQRMLDERSRLVAERAAAEST